MVFSFLQFLIPKTYWSTFMTLRVHAEFDHFSPVTLLSAKHESHFSYSTFPLTVLPTLLKLIAITETEVFCKSRGRHLIE